MPLVQIQIDWKLKLTKFKVKNRLNSHIPHDEMHVKMSGAPLAKFPDSRFMERYFKSCKNSAKF